MPDSAAADLSNVAVMAEPWMVAARIRSRRRRRPAGQAGGRQSDRQSCRVAQLPAGVTGPPGPVRHTRSVRGATMIALGHHLWPRFFCLRPGSGF
jgi:hypothetical protein